MTTRRFRYVAAAAIAAAAVFAIQGCSGSGAGGSSGSGDFAGKSLTVITSVNGAYPEQQKDWFSYVTKKFKKETGATVKFDTFSSTSDVLTRIQTSVVSNQGPDVFELGTTFTPTAYSTGAFKKLSDADWKAVGGQSRFRSATLSLSGPAADDRIAVPSSSLPYVLVYNKKMFKDAGIDKPASDWDGLLEQAKKLTTADHHGLAMAYGDTGDTWKIIRNMTLQLGNPLVDGKKVTIDDPTTATAYKTMYSWLQNKVVDPAAVSWNDSQALANFAAGKSAIMLGTSGLSQNTLDASSVKGDWAYAPMPTVPPGHTSLPAEGKPATSIVSGNNLVVASYSQNQDLALRYINFVTSKTEQVYQNKVFGILPTNDAAAKQVAAKNTALAPVLQSGKTSFATPFVGAWGDIQLQLSDVTVQLIPQLQKGSVSDAAVEKQLQSAQTAADKAVSRSK